MKTGFSPLAAGTMNWGVWDKNLSVSEMGNLIHICTENGITTFDHADIYGGYTTEAEFGNALTNSKIAREKIQLITKCGIALPVRQDSGQHITDNRNNKVKHYDYSKKYIIWSVENSLKNLQTDYVDALLLHRPSPLMQSDEIAEAVSKLKSDGKILDFGLSNFLPSQTELIRQKTNVGYNQIQFSATHYQAMLDGSLDYMQLHGVRPMAWNPLGIVFRENTEQARRLKIILAALVEKYDAGSDIILLAWILQHPANIIPVVGTANIARIKYLHKAVSLKLEIEDWFAIWTESMGSKVP